MAGSVASLASSGAGNASAARPAVARQPLKRLRRGEQSERQKSG